ncbi:PadR family transcriptional regulator [Nocardia asteroides]|uniref:PadR family transcriptional regulator n=1 Tax=Nocardia asteroides TaxID=1824 RepID=UPI0034009061
MPTTLGVAVMSLLTEQSMHPYGIYQRLKKPDMSGLIRTSPGSLYRTVARLAEQGLLTAIKTGRTGNRPEYMVYRITTAGRDALRRRCAELLAIPAREYPSFLLGLSVAGVLPGHQIVTLLRERLSILIEFATDLDALPADNRERDEPSRSWIELDYSRAVLDAQISWLNTVIARLETGATGADTPSIVVDGLR